MKVSKLLKIKLNEHNQIEVIASKNKKGEAPYKITEKDVTLRLTKETALTLSSLLEQYAENLS